MKTERKDPVCGMRGKIRAHGNWFCSESCIRKYEKREGIKYPIINDGVCTRACIIILHGVHLANSALKSGV